MIGRSILGWTLALACAAACQRADPIAQTIVYVDAARGAREAVTRIRVQAVGPADNREPSVETEEPRWPIKLVFAPKNADASRRFALTIDARDARDQRLATIRLRTGFLANETRYLRLMIHDGCSQQPAAGCGEGEACHRWSGEIAAKELGASSKKARTVDVTCEAGMDGEPPDDIDEPEPTGGTSAPQAGSGTPTATGEPSANAGTGGAASEMPARPVVVPTGSDICATGNPCGENGRCRNEPNGHSCECEPGYASGPDGCANVDECATGEAGCEGDCVDSEGSFECRCQGESWLRADRKACGSFAPAERLALTTSTQPMHPRFAFDAAGNGLAVWLQSDGTRTYLWTRRWVASQGWAGRASRFPTGESGNASSPRVALDPSGRGVILWLQSVDTRDDVWAARYDGGAFGTALLIETDDAASAFDPSVALDDAGNGLAVWSQSDGTLARIRVNRFDAATGWSEAFPIQLSMTDDAVTPRLAMDGRGNAIVGWSQYFYNETEGARISPWTARYDATLGRWRLPTAIDEGTLAGVPDSQLFDPAGHAVTVWSRATQMRVAVWARSRTAAGDRSELVQIGPASGLAPIIPRLALSPMGNGAAIWAQGTVGALDVWANRYDGVNDQWAEAAQLSRTSSTSLIAPAIAVDPNGDGFGVWSEIAGTARTVRAARLQAAGGFAAAIELTTDATAESPTNSPPSVAIDRQGAAIVMWDVWNEGRYELWGRRFE